MVVGRALFLLYFILTDLLPCLLPPLSLVCYLLTREDLFVVLVGDVGWPHKNVSVLRNGESWRHDKQNLYLAFNIQARTGVQAEK